MATKEWPEAVERVSSYLREARRRGRVEEFPEGTPTAKDAARAAGCELGQIVKSLVFDCDGRSVVALVPGDRRADSDKIARAADARFARIAGSEEVRDATGFEPGAVCPFPLPRVAASSSSARCCRRPVLWIGAGSERHMAALSPTELAPPLARSSHGRRRATAPLPSDRRREETSVRETEKIWMNGELVDWADARIHVGAHGLHYGSGVFEGSAPTRRRRARPSSGSREHLKRLDNSAKLLNMELPYSVEELRGRATS